MSLRTVDEQHLLKDNPPQEDETTYSPLNLISRSETDNLRRIATNQSVKSRRRASVHSNAQSLNRIPEIDPVLDPQSPHFSLQKWLQALAVDIEGRGLSGPQGGILFRNLTVSGSGAALQLQDTVSTTLSAPFRLPQLLRERRSPARRILNNFNGVMKSGELLLVLGRPGAGCSTLLKTICGQTNGLDINPASVLHYNGVSQTRMMKEFKGEVVYNQEVDKHFPHLTVGQTLEFAAAARTPSSGIRDMTRDESAKHAAQVVMAIFGLSHTYNTKVGNDFIRGVSGGERKRVSIAEMALAATPFAAWDNSSRGLDSATALKFVEALRLLADLMGSAHVVAIYQASQSIYEVFDKVTVLYEGRQIFFGPIATAKGFFERQGWECPTRQTTGDFLTSVTNPQERRPRPGMEGSVPQTPEDFEKYWLDSPEYKELQQDMASFEETNPPGDDDVAATYFRKRKHDTQSKRSRPGSPYLLSVPMQIKLNTKRAYQRVWNDFASTQAMVAGNVIMAVIIGSVFYGTPDTSAGFYSKGGILFFAVLLNALTAMSEINSLYAQRPIVEKQASYAFYHPATEAIAGVVSDIPVKFVVAVVFNVIMYFMSGLRREPSQFFIFFLISFMIMFVMSAVFRTMAAVTKTISQAMGLAGVLILALILYTGFVLPVPSMHPWFEWIHYINPIYYAFEILIANEFHGRDFPCAGIVPAYADLNGKSFSCSVQGAVPGETTVSGDQFILSNYEYSYDHVWRNFGILAAFLIAFMAIYFVATELNSSTTSTAEALVFRRGHEPEYMRPGYTKPARDEENAIEMASVKPSPEQTAEPLPLPPQKDIFTWRDICYDIEIKGEPRRLLDHVSGWVKPGTLTALMGVSGAGKTTLLDVLAHRTSMGVITGDMFVNGKGLDASFQRKTGYVQQQDLHLETATVRESLRFSALLRQPATVSTQEKYDYVEDVIRMLGMDDFAEAIVGVVGEGLNVEQRKLLTIGVELAAKPKLLLFLDEPTSGLDSQSSWAICSFLRKLADSGQAILCTIHQPSAILFQEFDQLLFLARGGKTVYFGPVGENSRTLLDYFESNGGRQCGGEENPAEYMIEVVNGLTNDKGLNWFDVWKQSPESAAVQAEIQRIHEEKSSGPQPEEEDGGMSHAEFAMPFWFQLKIVTIRVFQQYWRMPEYIISKWGLAIMAGLFIGFSFYDAKPSLAGMQNVVFSLFMVCSVFASLVQQVMPLFVTQRSLYEVRERPSKAYSWKVFILANMFVEIPYQIIMGILTFVCYYYAVVGASQPSSRQGLVLLFCMQFYIYASTFAHFIISALPDAQTASTFVVLLFSMSLTFCGVMQPPSALPGFWIFMYRVSPFTYWIGGIAATQVHEREVVCSTAELSIFDPPENQTCQSYMAEYMDLAGGALQNPDATEACRYCSLTVADQYLAGSQIYWTDRWRNFGLIWVYVVFNIAAATVLYYLFRVRKWDLSGLKRRFEKKKAV
ncbi:ABC-2 type transporter-domain-containing protein [Aspergillus karnatakaensis]|uniref:putative ABC multidrug transporter n=1 Tax=Aspergillus karnatakaensis TaxID=1810916 RepID=UPI003CCD9B8C